ncbi:MAG: ABC transporter substrate-binding protein [Alphaproteobacteria bacterium]
MRNAILGLIMAVLAAPAALADGWDDVLARAKGQTVYFNAWGGSDTINAYIAWAGEEVEKRYGVKVSHVKLTDTADAVNRVLAERTAGRDSGGSVDLIWINGENFANMKRNGLLHGPWAESLPSWRHVDVAGKPTVVRDFTEPTDGLEAPWGMAQFVLVYDQARVATPPRTLAELAAWAKANPGRFTYPQPPDFLGTTFLKQAVIGLNGNDPRLAEAASDAALGELTAPLWAYLDDLHPAMWRSGRAYPANGPAQIQLLGDGEVDIALSFDPSEAASLVKNGQLPDTVRTFVFEGGTIGNTHFVAIPYNAAAKEGAQVLANFLLSPEAQARKQDPRYWGSFTVLAMDKLTANDRARFDALDLGAATLSAAELGKALGEPHASWMERIEVEWARRYAAGQ